MKKLILLTLFLWSLNAWSQTGAVQGHSFLGGTQAQTQGLKSANYMNGVIPSATVCVYLTGTQTPATIYSDAGGDPLSSCFTSNASTSINPGGWIFWTAISTGVDVIGSGGIAPNTYAQPTPLCIDCYASSAVGAASACPVFAGSGQYCVTAAQFDASGSAETTTTSGTNAAGTAITLASCIDFTSAGAGIAYGYEGVYIAGAGTAGAAYVGTAVSCTGTTLTVNPATSTTVSSGALVQHDESAAFNAAVSLANGTTATTIWVPDGTYNVNGSFQQPSGANAIIAVPSVPYVGSPLTAPDELTIKGVSTPTMGGPTAAGAVIQSRSSGSSGAVYYGAMIGGYAGGSGLGAITNVDLHLENLTFRTYDNPQISAINGDGLADMTANNVNVDTGLAMNCGYGVGGDCNGSGTAPTTPTNSSVVGIASPQGNNYGDPAFKRTFVTGYYTDFLAQEHAALDSVFLRFGYNCLVWNVQGHNATAYHVNTEHCVNGMTGTVHSGSGIQVDDWSFENNTTDLYDPTNALRGWINYEGFLGSIVQNGGIYLTLGGIAGDLAIVGNQWFGNSTPQSINGGSLYFWNLSNTFGESDFINNSAAATPGGFDFLTTPHNGSPATIAHFDLNTGAHFGAYVNGTTDLAQGGVYLGDVFSHAANVGIWRGNVNGTTAEGDTLNLDGKDSIRFNVGAAVAGSKTNVGICTTSGCTFSSGSHQWSCQPGLGDGTDVIPAATYYQTTCMNTTGATVTLTGLSCYANAGTPTMNAAGHTLGALLTGAVTCSTSFAAGTQSANVALTNGDYITFTFVAGGSATQTTWVVRGTY